MKYGCILNLIRNTLGSKILLEFAFTDKKTIGLAHLLHEANCLLFLTTECTFVV